MDDNKDFEHVGDVDVTQRNSEIINEQHNPNQQDASPQIAMCWFNGRQFGEGAVVCSGGRAIICNRDGRWAQYGKC